MISYLKSPDSFLALPGPLLRKPGWSSLLFPLQHHPEDADKSSDRAPGSGVRAVCSWPVAVTCVGAGSCVPSRPGRCARSLGSSPEANTKLEMTLVATLLMAGDGAVGEWTARAIGIVTCYQHIDGPSEYDTSPAKHVLTQTGQEHAWPLPLCAMG